MTRVTVEFEIFLLLDVTKTDGSDSETEGKTTGATASRIRKPKTRLPSYRKSTAASRARKDGQGR